MRRYPEKPLVGVGAVVIRNGKILLVKRANEPNKGKWSVPGGLVRAGETLEEALKREMREELGVEVEVGDVACVTDEIFYDGEKRVEYHYVVIDFYADIDGEPKAMSDAADVGWFELERVGEIGAVDFVLRLVENITKNSGKIYLRE
ncbi:ADP-ribose pyrophosphatase [Geoglobus ahangari]|uniref:ADP-ribose pyrophosphatase n=2 Tax=Geoglobus ahangari TaxID=113653 RepID=A0A0F7ID17_9EURY|nr:ADP-ribose pyrophosphatase [Geoglobus ahangari]